jgi:hypothetical protein
VKPLPTSPAWQLPHAPPQQHWLIEDLWADQAVGILGGEPKCGKSFLALDMAVSVASGTPCLRRFPIGHAGPVLLYAAEDALTIVRTRLDGICAAAGISLRSLDLQVITVPRLRLDLSSDCHSLQETVAALRPRLLVLDPLIRLHARNENLSAEIAPLLSFLRTLQRLYHTAVVLVHHARKAGAHLRAGQALRGSSELHAWGDSNLYLQRFGNRLRLSVEHRAAASIDPLTLELRSGNDALALHINIENTDQQDSASAPSAHQRVISILQEAEQPLSVAQIRSACRIRTATLCEILSEMRDQGRVSRTRQGYHLTPS